MTICYFGIYTPSFSRNRVYLKGLRENGITVLECCDSSLGLLKYWRLLQKYLALPAHDAVVVGYPGHLVVPFARLIARAPVIADLLGSLSDAELHSHAPSQCRLLKSRLIDWYAVRSADMVLLESEAQKKYFEQRFGISDKYRVLYTGADDTTFHCDTNDTKDPFVVLFRGRLTPECGILHILEAAKLLKDNSKIHFRIIGAGAMRVQTESFIQEHALTNVALITDYLSDEALREKMCDASLMLGQFEDNPRLSRTIPHKAFEAYAMGTPYVSGSADAVREVVTDGETGFLVPLANAHALAHQIEELSENKALCARVGRTGHEAFTARFAPRVLAKQLIQFLDSYRP